LPQFYAVQKLTENPPRLRKVSFFKKTLRILLTPKSYLGFGKRKKQDGVFPFLSYWLWVEPVAWREGQALHAPGQKKI